MLRLPTSLFRALVVLEDAMRSVKGAYSIYTQVSEYGAREEYV